MPVSLIMVTIIFVDGNAADNLLAAATLQPDEIPHKTPSSRARRRAMAMESSEETVTTPST